MFRKLMQRSLCVVAVVCALLTVCSATAEPRIIQSSEYINAYSASLAALSDGEIGVYVRVDAARQVTELGATKIVLYEFQDATNATAVKTFYSSDYPSMLSSGLRYHKIAVTYAGTVGRDYYAVVTCYAGNDNGNDSRRYTTSIVTAQRKANTD